MQSVLERRQTAISSTTIDRWSFAGAILLSGFFLATSIYIASHRLFWYDEVFTTFTARMRDWRTIWAALVHENADPTPFGFFAFVRTSDQLFGPGEIGIRLPSVLAMTAGMWLVYDCVRRLTSALYGLIAMAILTCSYVTFYGYEGRCYALYFMFAAAVLWAWTGKRPAIVIGALFFVGMLIHYYLALCLLPFVAEEALNWRPWRMPSGRLIAAGIGAISGLAALLPQVFASRSVHGDKWWAAPRLREVASVYTDFFPAGLFLLAVIVLWLVLTDRYATTPVRPVSDAERTAWFSLAIPIAGWVGAVLVTHAFLHRYFIGVLPGIAVGFACMLWRRYGSVPRIGVGIALIIAGYGVANQATAVAHWNKINENGPTHERTRDILAMEDQFQARGYRYLVFDDQDNRCIEVQYYSKHPERYAWWKKAKATPSQYYHIPFWTLDDVKSHAKEVVLVDVAPERLETLQRAGLHPRLWEFNDFFFTFLE
ncbi:MAG: hypothetical protein JWP63_6308 [Candidatus Solibacter sp.]|nr:hypothetical protein [Candidatus Solibacter sp.]